MSFRLIYKTLLFFLLHFALEAQNVEVIKKEIQISIEKQKENLIKTSDAIWEFA